MSDAIRLILAAWIICGGINALHWLLTTRLEPISTPRITARVIALTAQGFTPWVVPALEFARDTLVAIWLELRGEATRKVSRDLQH